MSLIRKWRQATEHTGYMRGERARLGEGLCKRGMGLGVNLLEREPFRFDPVNLFKKGFTRETLGRVGL